MFSHVSPKSVVVIVAFVVVACSPSIREQDTAGSLQGVVKSSSGDPVSGAFVKLKNAERRLTFMVISQAEGRYTASNLPAGKYVVQGVGGDHQSSPSPVDVVAGRVETVDLSLTDLRKPQYLPGWPGRPGVPPARQRQVPPPPSLPEGKGKQIVETKCVGCHDANVIVRRQADRAGWAQVIENMRMYAQGSTMAEDLTDEEESVLLDYAATHFSVSGSGRETPKPADSNTRLPRYLLQGDATKYVAVEYELPDIHSVPHEVAVDSDGNGWVTQRAGGHLGRLDIKTLTYTEMDMPPAASEKLRLNGIVAGPDNKLWFMDGGPNRRWLTIDSKTREFTTYPLPPTKTGNASGNTMRVHPNGTVWLNSIAANLVIRLNPATQEFTFFEVPSGVKAGRTAGPYGMAIDGAGYIWVVENRMNQVARVDPVTGEFEEFPIPVEGPVARKAGMDSEGNIWVGLHAAGKLMKIDYQTLEMTVYDPPTENSGVYSVQGDPTSKLVWFSQQHVDMIARFDPETETFTEFPLPNAESDTRRIDIDPNNPNRIWWSGTESGRMGYIELIDGN